MEEIKKNKYEAKAVVIDVFDDILVEVIEEPELIGLSGYSGYTGARGFSGFSGFSGINGPVGINGMTGKFQYPLPTSVLTTSGSTSNFNTYTTSTPSSTINNFHSQLNTLPYDASVNHDGPDVMEIEKYPYMNSETMDNLGNDTLNIF